MRLKDRRQGVALVWTVVVVMMLIGFAGLALDWGYVYLTAHQLQNAADAAALAGVQEIYNSQALARAAAIRIAAANHAGGAAVVVRDNPSNDPTGDVVCGAYDLSAHTFKPSALTDANAVRVATRRTAGSAGGALPLFFGPIFGKTTADVSCVATAMMNKPTIGGFIGYNGITFKNNFFFGSYDSSVTKVPTQGGAGSSGTLGSNQAIAGKNNNDMYGTLLLGPQGTARGITIDSGSRNVLGKNIALPDMPAWTPQANPGGLPQAYTVNTATTLPGGTYWFTSLSVNADLMFSGNATVYVNGNIVVNASLTGYSQMASNLRIYQLGASRSFFGPSTASGSNHMYIIADVWAPMPTFPRRTTCRFWGGLILIPSVR